MFDHEEVAAELEALEILSQESGVCRREVGVVGLYEVGYSPFVGSVLVVQPQNRGCYHLQQNQKSSRSRSTP